MILVGFLALYLVTIGVLYDVVSSMNSFSIIPVVFGRFSNDTFIMDTTRNIYRPSETNSRWTIEKKASLFGGLVFKVYDTVDEYGISL